MSDRSLWTLYLAWSNFWMHVFVLAYLLWTRGANAQTRIVIEAIGKLDVSLEGFRSQSDAEHSQLERLARWTASEVSRILERFGFLTNRHAAEPVVPLTVKKGPGNVET